jgi:hypothetical protein
VLGSPSGVSVEPSSQNLSILPSLALSVISQAFIYRPEVSNLQSFLVGTASVPIESSPSESSPTDMPSLSSSLLSPSFGAPSIVGAVS